MKKKNVAGILAFILGIFGVHRFYLGQKAIGLVHLGSFFIGLALSIFSPWDNPALFFAVPAIIGLIDSVLFFVMPQIDFDKKYNAGLAWKHQTVPATTSLSYDDSLPSSQKDRYKKMGLESYRTYDYESAVKFFQKALDFNYKDPAIHFNLACCYSIMEQAENSFFHLDKAVDFGFDNFQKIHNHEALAYIRTHLEFDAFVHNHYQMNDTLLGTKEDLLSTTPTMDKKVLDKIASLGELRDKGFLTEEEFSMQKRRLLKDD